MLRLRGFHPLLPVFPVPFCCILWSLLRSEPRNARAPVWALSISLAATLEIEFSFSSSGYLDVSVHRVPLHGLWIQSWIHGVFPCGFPHSDTRGSLDICSSPRLFAAYRVFLRLSVPRHPPCALFCLTFLLCIALQSPVLLGSFLVLSLLLVCCFLLSSVISLLTTASDVLTYIFDFRYSVFKVRLAGILLQWRRRDSNS